MAKQHDQEVMALCVVGYLQRIRGAQADMEGLEWRIRELRNHLQGLSTVTGDVGSSGAQHDKMAEGMSKLEELEALWSENASSYAADIAEAVDICAPHHVGRYALFLHHVSGLTWSQVGQRIGYCYKTAHALAKAAIEEVYYLMPEQDRRCHIPNSDAEVRRAEMKVFRSFPSPGC